MMLILFCVLHVKLHHYRSLLGVGQPLQGSKHERQGNLPDCSWVSIHHQCTCFFPKDIKEWQICTGCVALWHFLSFLSNSLSFHSTPSPVSLSPFLPPLYSCLSVSFSNQNISGQGNTVLLRLTAHEYLWKLYEKLPYIECFYRM